MHYETLHFPNVAIFNVDETGVSFKETGIQFSRIEWTQREKHNLISTRAEKSSTMISFVSAAGEVLFSCWIFKADFEKSNSHESLIPTKSNTASGLSRKPGPKGGPDTMLSVRLVSSMPISGAP